MDCFVAYAPRNDVRGECSGTACVFHCRADAVMRLRNDVFASILKIEMHNVDVAGGEKVIDGGFRDFIVEIGGLIAAHLIRLEFQELIVYRFRLVPKIADKVFYVEEIPFVKIRDGEPLDFVIARLHVFQHKVIDEFLQRFYVRMLRRKHFRRIRRRLRFDNHRRLCTCRIAVKNAQVYWAVDLHRIIGFKNLA